MNQVECLLNVYLPTFLAAISFCVHDQVGKNVESIKYKVTFLKYKLHDDRKVSQSTSITYVGGSPGRPKTDSLENHHQM